MEIEIYELVGIFTIGVISGIGAYYLRVRLEERSEMRVSDKILKKLGLPVYKEDDTFSHIFTHKKERRIEKAGNVIEELKPKIAEKDHTLRELQDKIGDSVDNTEQIQKEIEELKSKGAESVALMGYLAPELQKMTFTLKEMEYALSSKTQMDMQRIFMEQVEMGGTRKQVLDILQNKITGQVPAPEMEAALRVYREALSLAPSEYRKSMETWVHSNKRY